MSVTVHRYSERPELWDQIADLDAEVWPEYNRHGNVMVQHWEQLYEQFPDFQFVLFDDDDGEVLAEGHTIPCWWDGSVAGLGPGIDATLGGGFALRAAGGTPNTLSALAAEIPRRHRDRGLSAVIIREMCSLARTAGLQHVIAPVRPSHKRRYPLIPIERYMTWTRDDGLPFDPWVRVHVRLGGAVAAAIARSLAITASVATWQAWTGMQFPDDGTYVFPEGLAPLHVDRGLDEGTYWEPNIWVVHRTMPAVHQPLRWRS